MKRVSRERASERRSREGQRKGPWLARSREARFACPNRRSCSQARSSPVLLLGILSHVSAEIPQLRDITLSARYGQYQEWLTTVRFQKYWQTQCPILGLCIHRDSSKCTKHDGYYRHSPGSVDSFNFKSAGLNSNSVRLMKSSASEPGLSLFVPARNQ